MFSKENARRFYNLDMEALEGCETIIRLGFFQTYQKGGKGPSCFYEPHYLRWYYFWIRHLCTIKGSVENEGGLEDRSILRSEGQALPNDVPLSFVSIIAFIPRPCESGFAEGREDARLRTASSGPG